MTQRNLEIIAAAPQLLTGLVKGVSASPEGKRIQVVNPATEAVLSEVAETDEAGVDAAVLSARDAFRAGVWSRRPVQERGRVLQAIAGLIRAEAEDLAILDTASTGLSFHRSTLRQTHLAADWFDYFAGLIETSEEQLFRQLGDARTLVTREPVGVAALFAPWNIPLMSAALKLSAALAMGNSCILKPSEQSPYSAYRLMALLKQAGLPDGVVNLVNGRGAITGAALARHEDVDIISFTGGEAAGRAIQSAAALRFAKTTMELGGKSANIIFADADRKKALNGAVASIYGNNGQACLAGSRILVQRNIADEFIDAFIARTKALKIGEPFDPMAEMGPLASEAQLDRYLSFMETAKKEDVDILCGGCRAEGFDKGYYAEPAVLLAKSNQSELCQEEIFGPVATFILFDTAEEAVAISNDTRFGLAAYLWTENLSRALWVSDRLRAGTVLINTDMLRERNAPFGGFGQSGIDREGGRWSLNFYSEAKATVIAEPYAGGPK